MTFAATMRPVRTVFVAVLARNAILSRKFRVLLIDFLKHVVVDATHIVAQGQDIVRGRNQLRFFAIDIHDLPTTVGGIMGTVVCTTTAQETCRSTLVSHAGKIRNATIVL